MEKIDKAADAQERFDVEVAVIGSGLAGTATATALSRAGLRVAVVDTHLVYPPDFRAEKFSEENMAALGRIGLEGFVAPAVTPMDEMQVFRFGRLVARERHREYGYAYGTMINALRAGIPAAVHKVFGRVAEIETGAERQTVTLNDGRRIEARLLVVATGLGDAVRRTVGVRREEMSRAHSLSLAFALDRPAKEFPFQSLTYYGWKRGDRMAYLTLFPIGETMRANLFVYRTPAEAWTKSFRQKPQEMLCELAPELVEMCAGFGVNGAVEIRPIDLIVTHDYRRDGFVLVGDAFCTNCPAPGIGVKRVLNDVERLCAHVPGWMASPGMGREKIESFYDDAEKQAVDAKAVDLSYYARSLVTGEELEWKARRLRNAVVRKGLYAVTDTWRKLRGEDMGTALASSAADRLVGDSWRM